jgi:hypothetical protein
MHSDDEQEGRRLIDALALAPHPEGSWYRETWRATTRPGERAAGTAIFFLLEAHQRSHWHRVDADEHWFWHAGAPLMLSVAAPDGPRHDMMLGADIMAGQIPRVGYLRIIGRHRHRKVGGRLLAAPLRQALILQDFRWLHPAGRRPAKTYPHLSTALCGGPSS